MKPPKVRSRICLRPDLRRLEEDSSEFKDVYDLGSNEAHLLRIRSAFEQAGYHIRSTELSPHRPVAVVILRLAVKTAPLDETELRKQVIQLLRPVGIQLKRADVSAWREGRGFQVSFLWQPPEPGSMEEIPEEWLPIP